MMQLPEKLDDKIKECLDRAIEELENGQGILHEIITGKLNAFHNILNNERTY